jgi:hypothetical protein
MSQEQLVAMAEGVVAAFAAAAAVLLLCGWPWRWRGGTLVSVGAVVGLGLGFYAGCYLACPPPRFPPREAQDRFLVVLFPAVLAVELWAALFHRPPWLIWLLRAVVAACSARVLLHDSSYLTDLSGPGTAEWTPAEAFLRLAILAAALLAVWALLGGLMSRVRGRSVPLALALTCGGAALVVMLSGYAGGMLGLPLAAALAGVAIGSRVSPRDTDLSGTVGPGVVGLFSLLLIAHFFSSLRVSHAVLLFAAPLACWLPEVRPFARLGPRVRGLVRVLAVAVPVAFILVQAGQKFAEASGPKADENAPSADDYSNFTP